MDECATSIDVGPAPGLDVRRAAIVDRLAAAERRAAAALPSDDPLDPERRRRVDATGPELLAQPDVVRRNWAAADAALGTMADGLAARPPDRVLLTGAGDSLAVLSAARSALEAMLGVPCEPVQCLELALYPPAGITSRTLVIALSSSGETTRTVQAALVARAAGAATLALTNNPASTLATESAATLLVDATRVGWPTQSSTAPLALLLRLAALVGLRRRTAGAAAFAAELDALPELMTAVLAAADPAIAELAADERDATTYSFAGAGPNWGTAVVGAAKVKECTPDHALAVHVEEFHHYNSLKTGEPLWIFVPSGPAIGRGVDTVHEAHRLGGHVHVVTSTGEHAFDDLARSVLRLPTGLEALSPLLYFLPAQLVGYHLARAKFAAADAHG